MDNYPMGAAHDPQAPYNEQEVEVEVVATATMQQITTLFFDPDHYAVSDGGYEIPDIDLQEAFCNENPTPQDLQRDCLKIVNQLINEGTTVYAGVHLPLLRIRLQAWSQENLNVRASR